MAEGFEDCQSLVAGVVRNKTPYLQENRIATLKQHLEEALKAEGGMGWAAPSIGCH